MCHLRDIYNFLLLTLPANIICQCLQTEYFLHILTYLTSQRAKLLAIQSLTEVNMNHSSLCTDHELLSHCDDLRHSAFAVQWLLNCANHCLVIEQTAQKVALRTLYINSILCLKYIRIEKWNCCTSMQVWLLLKISSIIITAPNMKEVHVPIVLTCMHCKNHLVKMTTSEGYCSFRVHWTESKTQLSSINPHTTPSQSIKVQTASRDTCLLANIYQFICIHLLAVIQFRTR